MFVQPVRASGAFYIRADGSIDPPTAPISTVDNTTYTLTGDIINDSVVVEKDNIVLDGAEFTIQGEGGEGTGYGLDLSNRNNVTVKNMTIKAFEYGIFLASSSSNIISENNMIANFFEGIYLSVSSSNSISGNKITTSYEAGIGLWSSSNYNSVFGNNITANGGCGILIEDYSVNNSIIGNDITVNGWGIQFFDSSSGNSVFHNNLVNNGQQVSSSNSVNIWDDGYPSGGNYWSNYAEVDVMKGPNQDQPGSDNIGDTPYFIDAPTAIDHYPLMNLYWSPAPTTYSLTITATAGGATNPPSGTYLYSQGQSVLVQATPNIGWSFDHWELDGLNVGSMNSYTALVDNDHSLYAAFVQLNYTLTITTTAGGTTDPVPEVYTYGGGSDVQITAIPDINYILDHWELDGSNVGSANPFSVLIDDNHTLQAVFVHVRIHDVAIANVTLFKTVVGQGYSPGNMSITVANRGDYVENINVTAYYANDTFTPAQWNEFGMLGDVTRDGYITMADINTLIYAFNARPGDPRWNPNLDIYTDGIINMKDIAKCIQHLGSIIWKYYLPAIGTQTITNLTNGESTTLAFTWNTTGLTYGNYTMTLVAPPDANETNTADNNFTSIAVTVTIPGDINGDFRVNLVDLVLLANAYGSHSGDPKWNPNADINSNGVVDLIDLVILANHYGQHYP